MEDITRRGVLTGGLVAAVTAVYFAADHKVGLYRDSSAEAPISGSEASAYIYAIEAECHRLTNLMRRQSGQRALSYDSGIADGVARPHSAYQVAHGYTAHDDERRGMNHLRDRMKAGGYTMSFDGTNAYTMSGENSAFIGGNQVRNFDSAQMGDQLVVKGWMTSPGHRKNLLRPEFTHQGIGISIGQSFNKMPNDPDRRIYYAVIATQVLYTKA